MAVLSEVVRLKLWRGLMRYWSQRWDGIDISAGQLLEAVEAADDWIDAAGASYNNSLPAAAKANMTADQKGFLLACVALARGNVDLLRNILGGTD